VLTKLATRARLKAGQPARSDAVQRIQSFDASERDLASIAAKLPANAAWLDLGSGNGVQFDELLHLMYASEIDRLRQSPVGAVVGGTSAGAVTAATASPASAVASPFPASVVFLDSNRDAAETAATRRPPWWPAAATRRPERCNMRSRAARRLLDTRPVLHMSHLAYRPSVVRAAVDLLRRAKPETLLLVRYTSETTFYRVISTSTACAPLRPYIHHHMHQLLLRDLERHGWHQKCSVLLNRTCRIATRDDVTTTVDWCDAQYGEFSGDIVERYFVGLHHDGAEVVSNCDRVVLLRKDS
jgi:hypothetical protein